MIRAVKDPALLLPGCCACLPGRRRACRSLGRRSSLSAGQFLPGGTSDIGGDDVGGMPIQTAAGTVVPIVVRGSACEAASCTSRSETPASSAAVMNACRKVCGPTGLVIPARRAALRTIRPALCRSSR
jgi:hypothetical protein